MKPIRPVVGLAASALLGVTGFAAATAPAAVAAPAQIRVITHNIEKKQAALDTVLALKDETTGPELLFLQEVCGDMLPQLDSLGLIYQFHDRRETKCEGTDKRLGEVVVWTGSGGMKLEPVRLLTDGDQKYGMACLDVRFSDERIRACSTHLVAGRTKEAAFRLELTEKIRRVTKPWIVDQNRTVVLGGDFNTNPTYRAMDPIYGVGNDAQGRFREIAQTAGSGSTARDGLWTSGKLNPDGRDTRRKIDYVFVSKNGSRPSGGSEKAMASPSNHRVLYGVLPLR